MPWSVPSPQSVSRSGIFLVAAMFSLGPLAAGQVLSKAIGLNPVEGQKAKVAERAIPLVFEENAGQLPGRAAFAGRTRDYTIELDRKELRFEMLGGATHRDIVISFIGADTAKPESIDQAGFRTNYYVGANPKLWRTGIRNYYRVALRQLYPGIDAEFYSHGSEIEHDFVVAPGADASVLAMHITGAAKVSLDSGDVDLNAENGYLRLHRPVVYQVLADGQRHQVDASFDVAARGDASDLRFKLGAYDHSRQLVIDPVITYATYATGTAGSTASTVAADSTGGVYLSGVTSSAPGFAGVNAAANCPASSTCTSNIFVAKFAGGSYGTTLAWLTYVGVPGATATAVTASVVSNATPATNTTLYVGGYTNATAMASGPASAATNSTGGYVGFVSGLNANTGTLAGTNFIYVDNTAPNNVSVGGLAVDSTGNLYVAGSMGTTITPPMGGAYSNSANSFGVITAPTTYTSNPLPSPLLWPGNAYVLEYASGNIFSAGSPMFFSYIQPATALQGIKVDASGNIYIAGETMGNFSSPPALATETNSTGTNDAFEMTFTIVPVPVAPALPSPPTVSAFNWIDAGANTMVAALDIDNLGNVYLFGNTLSASLGTALAPPTGAPCVTTMQCSLPDSSGTGSGYVAVFNNAGVATGYTYLGGSGATDVVLGGGFSGGSVYVVGQTDAPGIAPTTTVPFANVSTTQTSAISFNGQALAFGQDSTVPATPGTVHGYLASLPASLGSVNYVANFGGTNIADTADAAVAVAFDNSSNAYVAATIGAGSTPYAPYAAFEATNPEATATPPATNPAAYLAEVSASSIATNVSITSAIGSPTPDPIGYSGTVGSTVTYTWNVSTANVAVNNLVIGIAANLNLNYTSAMVIDPTANGNSVGSCSLAPAVGVSCVVPTVPQTTSGTNDTLQVVLAAVVNSTAYPPPTQITITATVQSAASEYSSSSQVSQLSSPSNLQFQPITPSTPTVYAAGATYASYTGTTVTYPIMLVNSGAGAGEAKNAKLTVASIPTGFVVLSVTANASGGGTVTTAGCDLSTTAMGCTADLPPNAVLTYSITGYYSDTVLFPPASVTPSVAAGPFSVSANGFLNTVAATALAPNTTIQRAIDISTTKLTVYDGLNPTTPKTTFNLGTAVYPSPVGYTYVLTNAGPSIAYNVPLTVAYPIVPGTNSFVPVSATGTDSNQTAVTCTLAAGLSCSVGQIAPGKSAVITLTASYPDLAPLADAVPAGAKSNVYSIAGTAAAPSYFIPYGTGSTTGTFAPAPVTIQRSATLTIALTPLSQVAPSATCPDANPCVYMYNSNVANLNPNANQYDTATYGATVTNIGPNASTATSIVIPLPAAPSTSGTAPTVHILTPATVNATPSSTPAAWAGDLISSCTLANNQYTCGGALATGIPAPTSTTAFSSVTVSVGGTFDSATVPPTQVSVNTSAQPGSVSVSASVITPAPATTSFKPYSIVRSSHLVLRKSRNTTGLVAVAPAGFADKTDPNLDEEPGLNSFGKNDEIEYEVALGNGGVNDAPGVTFTDKLPSYFTVETMKLIVGTSMQPDAGPNTLPAAASAGSFTCYAGTSATGTAITLPYKTTSAQSITCVMASGVNLAADKSTGAAGTSAASFGTSAIEFVYQGKFQDNAPNIDNILSSAVNGLYTVTSAAGDATAATALATDYLPAADHSSLALPAYPVQRAVHLAVVGAPLLLAAPSGATTGPDQILTMDPVTGRFQVGEAEPSSTGSATPVFNCMRYKVYVQNAGPNISRTPTLTINGDQIAINSTNFGTTTSTTQADTALTSSCSSSYGATKSPTVAASSATVALSPTTETANNSMVFDMDGYFPLNTLGVTRDSAKPCYANCGARTAAFGILVDPGAMDSAPAGTQFATPIPPVTVVNTPTGGNFTVKPFSTTLTQPATLTFSSVTVPGVTSQTLSSSGPAITPITSPYPPDNGLKRALYQPGRNPVFYTLPTTATAPGGNLTTVCVGSAGSTALPDVFVKPERTLMWVLANTPSGTVYQPVPYFIGTGDITVSVTPSSGAYTTLTQSSPTIVQPAQAQPAQVCGQVNGFSSVGSTFAVLEPVNFPPIVAGVSYTASGTGKGSTDNLNNVTVAIGTRSTVGIYDYNDADPCYIGSPGTRRAVCNDNPYLNVWLFGGGNIGQGGTQTLGPVPLAAGQLFTNVQLSTGTEVFVAAADQTIWADQNASSAYTSYIDPFTNEGNFLKGPLNGTYTVCDPGISSSVYVVQSSSTGGACQIAVVSSAQIVGTPPESYVSGSGTGRTTAYLLGGVGAGGFVSSVTGTGLFSLPSPDPSISPISTSSPPSLPVNPSGSTPELTITAGQTAGFSWGWLAGLSSQTGSFTLSCSWYDSATQAVKQAGMPVGVSCTMPTTYTFGVGAAPPSIYVVTTGTSNAQNTGPRIWGGLGGMTVALLAPWLLGWRRRNLRRQFHLMLLLLVLASVATLSGCGAGIPSSASTTVTPAGSYYFRAAATQGSTTITTSPFEVIVKGGD